MLTLLHASRLYVLRPFTRVGDTRTATPQTLRLGPARREGHAKSLMISGALSLSSSYALVRHIYSTRVDQHWCDRVLWLLVVCRHTG